MRLTCQNSLNRARNLCCTGEYEQFEQILDVSMSQATKFESWYFLAQYVHCRTQVAYSTKIFSVSTKLTPLYIKSSEFTLAQTHIVQADEIFTREGGFAKRCWISGLCSYRAACAAISQGRIPHAIEQAEKAMAIGELVKASFGVRARYTHVLSKALLGDPERQEEGEQACKEAQRLRALLPKDRMDLSDESDAAFERLVNMFQR